MNNNAVTCVVAQKKNIVIEANCFDKHRSETIQWSMDKMSFCGIFFASYLIPCGHYSYHREFLDLYFCDSHSGQKTDLRWAHVCPLSQHALPALNVVTDWPKVDGERMKSGKM